MNPTSSTYWLPRISRVEQLPIPKTMSIGYDHRAAVAVIEDGDAAAEADTRVWNDVLLRVRHAADVIGYPVFVRTDMSSAKHDGPDTYLMRGPDDAAHVVSLTVQDNELKFWLEPDATPTAILVREFLTLDAPFTAFSWRADQAGHPIAREWRYFADADGVRCRHFYWPDHAIDGTGASVEDWQDQLAELQREPPPAYLDDWAHTAARVCPEAAAWSVDFARDTDGQWWLIDMAEADRSWHPEHAQ